MIIKARSPYSGLINEMRVELTEHEYSSAYIRWKLGESIQDVFPTLNAEQREFILTGYTPEDWKAIFPPEEEEELKPIQALSEEEITIMFHKELDNEPFGDPDELNEDDPYSF